MLTKDLFISYGRRESLGLVGRLHQQLKLAGYEVWFDKVNIPDGEDYAERIQHGIETAHNFAYVMAPRCLTSPYCLMELEYARSLGKRVIPLNQMVIFQTASQGLSADDQAALQHFYADHHLPNPNLQTAQEVLERSLALIGRTDWLDAKELFSATDGEQLATWAQSYENHWHKHEDCAYLASFTFPTFGQAIDSLASIVERLQRVLQRHRTYVHQHTEILLEALHWQRHQQLTRHLLVGKERLQAEEWLLTEFTEGEQPPCLPTDLQCEFICESRKNSSNMTTQVFVCYDVADQRLRDQVVRLLARHAITTWRHECDIQEGSDFTRAIEYGIETADNFLYFLSPAALQSHHCQTELQHAFHYHKRIIPLLITPLAEEAIPEALRTLQYLDFTQGIQMNPLLKILRAEAEYYEEHKMLLARALRWQRENHQPALLLRGHHLEHALTWLRLYHTRTDHPPTESHQALITASEAVKGQLGTEVFISYSRKDGDFARKLNLALQEAGKTTWFDQESISSGVDFAHEIFKGIDNTDNFIFIISPDAVESPYCEQEVNYAKIQGKRFLPVLWRTTTPTTLPPALQAIHWINFEQIPFAKAFPELLEAIDLDREHARQHTLLQQRASDWAENDRSPDFLLNHTACKNAERWQALAFTQHKQPTPTPLQHDFIKESRTAIQFAERLERRRRNTILASVTIGLVIAVMLSIFSWVKMKEAEEATVQAKQQKQKAEEAKTQAEQQKNEALKTQSLFLADLSRQQTAQGSITHGILLALEGLPKNSNDDRPYVAEAKSKLYHAVLSFTPKWSESQILSGKGVIWSPDGKILATDQDNQVYLWNNQGQLLHILIGHEDSVRMAFSPDGQTLATASSDETARLWSVQHGQLLQTFTGHKYGVYDVAFSPDGQTLATDSGDQTVRLWSVQHGQLLHILMGHEDSINSMAFSPDGQTLATASNDQTARLWSVQHGQLLQTFTGHEGEVRSVAFSPDGQTLATASKDKTARLWSVQHGQLLQTFTGHENEVRRVAFSPDGQTLATASWDQTARLWSVKHGQLLQTFTGHEDSVNSVTFSPDGQTLATSSKDKTVRLWSVQHGQLLQTLTGHEDWVLSVAFSPDGQTLATASIDKITRLWSVKYGQLLRTLTTGREGQALSVAFSPDRQTLATASWWGTVRLWSVKHGQLLQTFTGHRHWVSSVAFSPDGQILATASFDKTARLWLVKHGQLLQTFTRHEGEVYSVAFSPDGQTLATASEDKTARLWSVKHGQLLQTFIGHEGEVYSVAFSPDGQTLATTSEDKTARLWSVQHGQLLQTFTGHEGDVNSVAFNPDGQTLATASEDKTARLWSIKHGRLLQTFTGHEGEVYSVAFSPDGQTLATASFDKTARLWSVQHGQLLQTFTGHEGEVYSVAFSPDGQTLATASEDKTTRLWRIFETQELIDYANRLVPRCLTPSQRQTFFLPPSQADKLITAGENLAKQGYLTQAIKQFQQAQIQAACLKFDPEARAKQLAAQAKIDQGEALAQEGKISAAVEEFKQALAIDSRFKLNHLEAYAQGLASLGFVEQGVKLAEKGKVDAALAQFQAAQALVHDIKIDVEQWNMLCQKGIAYGQVAQVIAACKKAVALEPNDWESLRNSGIANALLGNTACAIEDLQQAANRLFFEKDEENYPLIQSWVDALQGGNNPFTEEVLKTLR